MPDARWAINAWKLETGEVGRYFPLRSPGDLPIFDALEVIFDRNSDGHVHFLHLEGPKG